MLPAPLMLPATDRDALNCKVLPAAMLYALPTKSVPIPLSVSVPLFTLTTPVVWLLKVGVMEVLETSVLKTLRNSPALLKVPVPAMPRPPSFLSLRMKVAPAKLLNVPLRVSDAQQPAMALVTVPLLFQVRPAPSMPAEILIVEPAAVSSVAAAVASRDASPLQLKVPAAGIAMLPVPVKVPPDSVSPSSVSPELIANVPELCAISIVPLVVDASRTLLVPFTVALMPSPARKVTVPAA